MGGRFSRNKGRLNEQQLVLALSKLGYKAERILRQYQEAGQPDVKAIKGDKFYTFEMKSRRCSFKSIYDLYYSERNEDGVLAFVLHSNGVAVAASTDFEALERGGYVFRNLSLFPSDSKKTKVFRRLVGLKELKQAANYLVIKDNNKPRLYIGYWG